MKKAIAILGSTRSPSSTLGHIKALGQKSPDWTIDYINLQEAALPLFKDFRTEQNKWESSETLEKLYQEMIAADLVILASPLYWYTVSHPMKNFLDHWTYFLRHPQKPMKDHFNQKIFLPVIVGSGFYGRQFQDPVFSTIKLSVEYVNGKCLPGFFGFGERDGKPSNESLDVIRKLNLSTYANTIEELSSEEKKQHIF